MVKVACGGSAPAWPKRQLCPWSHGCCSPCPCTPLSEACLPAAAMISPAQMMSTGPHAWRRLLPACCLPGHGTHHLLNTPRPESAILQTDVHLEIHDTSRGDTRREFASTLILQATCLSACSPFEPYRVCLVASPQAEQACGRRGVLTFMAFTTSWHMLPTIAATAELSAPPLSGSRKPLAPERLR